MSLQAAFLKVLTENEDDLTTRLVYADWLEENGQHEEADRQRKWPAAKAWLVQFCRMYNPLDEQDPDETFISYIRLLDLGLDAVAEADEEGFGFHCGRNEDMCYALRSNSEEFWKNWSVVTGIPLPSDGKGYRRFSCAC